MRLTEIQCFLLEPKILVLSLISYYSLTFFLPTSSQSASLNSFPLTCIMICFFPLLYGNLWRRQWHPPPELLPGKSHGRRSHGRQAADHGVAKSRTRLGDFTFTFHFHTLEKEMATDSSVLAWRIPGTGEPVGCCLWGRTKSDTTEATQQQQHQGQIISL